MELQNTNNLSYKNLLLGWVIGVFLILIEILTFPFRILRLPTEWARGLTITQSGDGITIFPRPEMFGTNTILYLIISLLGLVMLVLITAYYGRIFGAHWKRSILISVLALLISFFIIQNVFEWLFNFFNNVTLISNIRFSTTFIFNLNFAVLIALLSQKLNISQNWLIPLFGYFISLTIAIIIQQVLTGTGAWHYAKAILQTPLAWLNVAFFFHTSLRKSIPDLYKDMQEHLHVRKNLCLLLTINIFTVGLTLILSIL